MTATAAKKDKLQIVVAWSDRDAELVKEGRVDIGERHQFRTTIAGAAVMWLRRGGFEDFAKAEAYAHREQAKAEANEPAWERREVPRIWRVFTYPTSERDPLGKARRQIVELATKERGRA